MTAAVSLDWLEVFCLEPPVKVAPMNWEYFRAAGYDVRPRDYGTPQYRECFTIYDSEFPSIEIRRSPYSLKSQGGLFDPRACHIRLSNRQLYQPHPVDYIRQFLLRHGYQFQSLSRVDICCDFNTFSDGRKPANFLRDLMRADFMKINQSRLSSNEIQYLYKNGAIVRGNIVYHAADNNEGRVFNSVKWGAPTSAISTKMYDKSLELQQVKPKKYIQQMWERVGLLNDEANHVWRVEYSIKSEIKNFVRLDDGELVYFSLSSFDTQEKLNGWFLQLSQIYFHFKRRSRTRNGTLQRKDRCPDYFPFRLSEKLSVMKPVRLSATHDPTRLDRIIMRRLKEYAQADEPYMNDKSRFAIAEFSMWLANHFAEKKMKQFAEEFQTRAKMLAREL